MRTNKLIILLPLLLAMMLGVTGCSSDDEEKTQDTQCYTIRINGTDGKNIVSGSLVNKPEKSQFIGHTVILFDESDLLGLNITPNDELDVMILSSNAVQVEGFNTGGTDFYFCKVKPCK